MSACDECAGTPSCHTQPEVSATGQFIERKTGHAVSGVNVTFIRRGDLQLVNDTLRATSDASGFFVLRGASVYANVSIQGDLLVTPPAPWPAYTIAGVSLRTSTTRGDGDNLGRFVVDPYLLLIGIVRDRKTLTPLVGASVTLRWMSGGRLDQNTMSFTTDFGGQFSWEPKVLDPAPIEVNFEVTAEGYPRTFVVPRQLGILYRDQEMSYQIIPVGYGLAYSATTGRRGSGEQLPGVTVTYVRTGGIGTQPAQATLPLDASGTISIPIEPLAEGTANANIIITPPAPLRPDTFAVQLATSDDDRPKWLGFHGYGAQVFLKAALRDAGTGADLPAGTGVTMKRTAGVALAWRTPNPDGDQAAVADSGILKYQAPTTDSGSVTYDMIVRLPAPFIPDTIRNLVLPARYSDSAYVATIPVRRRTTP